MALTPYIKHFFGQLGLLPALDFLRMHFFRLKNRSNNEAFKKKHPDFILPDDQILYETFRLDYHRYFESGLSTAQWLLDQYQKHQGRQPGSILDWGCGPARVIRHLPTLVSADVVLTGSDFNPQTIQWCKTWIQGVSFITNGLKPPIPIPPGSVDFIYAISVFTHLAAERHPIWVDEIVERLTPDGIFLFTTQGRAFLPYLTPAEQASFHDNKPVVRNHKMEGKRIFSTFHPEQYIIGLLSNFDILEHQLGTLNNRKPDQDVWIVRKK